MKHLMWCGLAVVAAVAALAVPGLGAGAADSAVAATEVPEAAVAFSRPAAKRPPAPLAALRRQVARLKAEVRRLRAQVAALSPAGIARQLEATKTALDRFRSVDAARAAGYVPASPCEATPEGGMGFHYVNPPLMADPAIDPLRPEILLYVPGSGGLELVGVEYLRVDADQNLATDPDRPAIFGRDFDGPMEGHGPGMPRHYDLHVWLWKRNPAGIFNRWNPDVRCS